ncbi:FAD-binding and (Fe-S)-binding domain-containing protein [Ruegeria sp. R14_0]|uniref:FAD-binding and (Fe-S)-binding domain-containing protein n=1 Tax=Ruegeria sp. R14_0 TaxID=2821100 RepID=UPI001ADCE5F1|nr:FAD-binding and (Fe-S)-binding domain-containing protein [Ruegeria sp. R14_0]MBO9446731.1 FAD-binding oxidoreductase [Ruegeria sp. R14_0]
MLDQTSTSLAGFLKSLSESGFQGDIEKDTASCLVAATDNSIYRLLPDAILFPKNSGDVQLAADLAAQQGIALTARGGGTGTNGQSLNTGVVLDTSRHMTEILSLDLDAGTVTVQPGVVLDQLNTFLKPHGVFFAPTVSTSSRATLGGMFATDASGKGSRIYGRMSDHVLAADLVLANGRTVSITTHGSNDEDLHQMGAELHRALTERAFEIARHYPKLNRGLTGYNLDQARTQTGDLNFIKLLAGSEGTLALTTQLTLRVTRLPKQRALTVLAFEDCVSALRHVPHLVESDPAAIEFLDDKILKLAAASPMWSELEGVLGSINNAGGFLFVEFTGETQADIQQGHKTLDQVLARNRIPVIAKVATAEASEISALWELRKRSVGLLAAVETQRIGLPFVEDAAVPPENLAQFVSEFSTLLDGFGLSYGMFGHADVGCVHVRPMLNMRVPEDRDLIRQVSDAVSDLCQRHGGLIWGEHGKGVRGEYVERYVGSELYGIMRQIKAWFDPDNRMNPGKLVTAQGSDLTVMKIDAVPFRGALDAEIDPVASAAYERAIACNGNGACHNWAPDDPMCPSFKVTRDKTQAPKGRATLFREWARMKSTGQDVVEVERALKRSLDTCLSCKSCSGQCPVRVDIPAMKSAFLNSYYQTHARTLRDRLLRRMEHLSLRARRFPGLMNLAQSNPLGRLVLSRMFGLTDVPTFSTTIAERAVLRAGGTVIAPGTQVQNWGARPVFLVLDSFTGVFETQVVGMATQLLVQLGFDVWATGPLANGKAQQVRGYEQDFELQRQRTTRVLEGVARQGVAMVSLEPAVTDLFSKEYQRGAQAEFQIHSLDRFLFDNLADLPALPESEQRFALLSHCTEKTADPATVRRWVEVFARFGLTLAPVSTGCCGMAGLFGHEVEHQDMSRDLFDLSWRGAVAAQGRIPLATGFSCRSQVKRFGDKPISHPVSALLAQLKTKNS